MPKNVLRDNINKIIKDIYNHASKEMKSSIAERAIVKLSNIGVTEDNSDKNSMKIIEAVMDVIDDDLEKESSLREDNGYYGWNQLENSLSDDDSDLLDVFNIKTAKLDREVPVVGDHDYENDQIVYQYHQAIEPQESGMCFDNDSYEVYKDAEYDQDAKAYTSNSLDPDPYEEGGEVLIGNIGRELQPGNKLLEAVNKEGDCRTRADFSLGT